VVSPLVILVVLFLLVGRSSTAAAPRPGALPPGSQPPGYGPPGYNANYAPDGTPISPATAAAAGAFIKGFLGGSSAPTSGTRYNPYAPYAPGSSSPGPYAPNYGTSSFTPYAPGATAPGPYAPNAGATGSGDGLLPLSDASTSGDVSTNDTQWA
jgi:hypothetical protein